MNYIFFNTVNAVINGVFNCRSNVVTMLYAFSDFKNTF